MINRHDTNKSWEIIATGVNGVEITSAPEFGLML